jgi:hypothetical protein
MIMASDCFANKIAASNPRREFFEPSKQTIILLVLIKNRRYDSYLFQKMIVDFKNKHHYIIKKGYSDWKYLLNIAIKNSLIS